MFSLQLQQEPLPLIWFSTVSLINHGGQHYPFHPLEASLPLLPLFLLHRLSFICLPLVIIAISPLIWDGLTPPFPHPSPAPLMTRSPCSPGPLTSFSHILTCSHISSPALLLPDLVHSLTHQLTHSLLFIGWFIHWQNVCIFSFTNVSLEVQRRTRKLSKRKGNKRRNCEKKMY